MIARPVWEIFGWAFLFLSGRTVFWQGLQYLASRHSYFKDRKIYHLAPHAHQLREELSANIICLIVESAFWTAVLHFGILPKAGGSVLFTFALSFVWWEVSYYSLHRAMHHPRLYFLHRHHHLARVNTPLSGSSFSVLEGLTFLVVGWGPLIALGYFMPLSYLGAFIYNELLMSIRTTGHFNSEMLPPWWIKLPGIRWIQTNTYHALHHARFKGHYGLMTVLPDRWGKTAFKDYVQVHAHVFQKIGMKSLGQRLTEDDAPVETERIVA